MIHTILISEVASALNYKDRRSVLKWCRAHGVEVYDDGCNRKYLVKLQFENARLKKFIRSLKECYGKDWQAAYEAYAGNDLLMLAGLESADRTEQKVSTRYAPKGQHEKRFLASLSDSSTEL